MLIPLNDRLIIKRILQNETTESGIFMPNSEHHITQEAEVLAIGPDYHNPLVKVGSTVILIPGNVGVTVEVEDEEVLIIRSTDIIALKPAPTKKEKK
jgi:chaperonin GroES